MSREVRKINYLIGTRFLNILQTIVHERFTDLTSIKNQSALQNSKF